jgi:two-component system, OmpR family, sensor kinase
LKPVASLGSYIRSAARATFSAYRSVPIRWRLAGGSAALTFVILAAFAAVVGVLTDRQVTTQFNNETTLAADHLVQELNGRLRFVGPAQLNCESQPVSLKSYAFAEDAQIRIFVDGELFCTQDELRQKSKAKAPFNFDTLLFTNPPAHASGGFNSSGYRVAVRELTINAPLDYRPQLLYARPLSDLDHTLARVRFFLLLGVLGGTVLALLAGLATAQRAIRPIRQLSDTAREIERTRDPSRHVPHPEANDEVAELARTLEGMLAALDAARGETETMLARQREFVADASHELRTPLTSVLANLELLAEELEGEQAESAQAALRSTRRMRRLVGDLLLLARADAKRAPPHQPTDLADVLTEAASELWPVAEQHELSIDAEPAVVSGIRDDLHRVALNLIENAIRHTPPGTHVRAATATENGDAMLIVEDDGPGIPPEIERRVFERFVRGAGDGGRGSGLGLAIVQAVTESYGGTVALEPPATGTGTRFVIRIPTAREPADGDGVPGYTSTTTGSTIGRRRSRS